MPRNRFAAFTAVVVVACGGNDAAGPTGYSDHHEQMVIESVPYDVIGQSRLAFRRYSNNPPLSSGIVVLDGRTKTASTHFSHLGFPIEVSPDGTHVVYVSETTFDNKQRDFDIGVSDLDSPNEVDLGGAAGARYYPSWTTDGSSIVFTESDVWARSPVARIVSQGPAPGSARQILWQRSGCEDAAAPHLNAAGDIVFIFYPGVSPDCNLAQYVARKKPGQATEILYGPGILDTPIWSPTGAEIAFFETPTPQQSTTTITVDLKAMSADGTNLRTLATLVEYTATQQASLCWSGDGSTLFFSLGDSQTEAHIYAVPASGGPAAAVTTQAGAFDRNVSCLR